MLTVLPPSQVSVASLVDLIGIDFGPEILAGDAGKDLPPRTIKKNGKRVRTAPRDDEEESLIISTGLGDVQHVKLLGKFEDIKL